MRPKYLLNSRHESTTNHLKFQLINKNSHSRAQSKDREAIAYLNIDYARFKPIIWSIILLNGFLTLTHYQKHNHNFNMDILTLKTQNWRQIQNQVRVMCNLH